MMNIFKKLKLPLLIPVIILLGLGWWAQRNSQLHLEPKDSQVQVRNVSATKAEKLLSDKEVFSIDVHIPEQEHLAGTEEFIPYNRIEEQQDKLPEDINTPILVYCRSGSMSRQASEQLIEMGYEDVYNLIGGVKAYRAEIKN